MTLLPPVSSPSSEISADSADSAESADSPSTEGQWVAGSPDKPRHRLLVLLLVASAYLGVAFYQFRPAWAHGPSRYLQAGGNFDTGQTVSFLAAVPAALAHGLNPLANSWLNWPAGVNYLDNTGIPLLGLVMAPVTVATNAVFSYNLMLTLIVWANCLVAYLVIESLVRNRLAAFIAGLLFGFSPMVSAASVGHPHVMFDLLAPVMFFLLWRLCTGAGSPWLNGMFLGVAMAAQLYVFAEPLADCVIVASIGLVIAAVVYRRVLADHILRMVRGLGAAMGTFVVLGGYGLYVQLLGPMHVVGDEHPGGFPTLASDLLGPILPTVNQRLSLGMGIQKGTLLEGTYVGKAWFPNNSENGAYIGVSLLVILLVGLVLLWRRPLMRWAAGLAVVSFILSMGPHLRINGHTTGIRLPGDVFLHLPLLRNGVPARFGMVEWFLLSLMLGIELAELYRYLARRYRSRRARVSSATAQGRWGRWALGSGVPAAGVIAVAVVGLVPLIPEWPLSYSSIPTASLTVNSQLRSLPAGEVVMGYPFADRNTYLMLAQVEAHMQFRLVGGYVLEPGKINPNGRNAPPPSACLTALNNYYTTKNAHVPLTASTLSACAANMLAWNVGAVLWINYGASPGPALQYLTALLGTPSVSNPDAALWVNAKADAQADVADHGLAAANREPPGSG